MEGEPRGVLLRVSYDGAAFHGWASQKKSEVRTVQDAIDGAVLAMDPDASSSRGTSRTDAGVHARAQMVAFDTRRDIPARGWVLGLNQHLPEDVAIRSARAVPAGYNPRFASLRKRYEYTVSTDAVRDPLRDARAWRIGPDVDLARMESAARRLLGTHDYGAFRASRDERTTTVRTITEASIARLADDPTLCRFSFEGTAFMYNMVRIMVGTLVDIGRGRLDEAAIAGAFVDKDRASLGMTAPGHGLVLAEITLTIPPDAGPPWPLS